MSSDSLAGVPIVLSGPSGVGKTTLRTALLSRYQDIVVSISATTRPKRPDEIQGKDYLFFTEEEFKEGINQNLFLEWATVHGEYYGTPKGPIEERLEQGTDVLLIIDIQGGVQVKTVYPQALLIFIFPPSMDDLQSRIENRASDSPDRVAERLNNANSEIEFAKFYDYWVINRRLEDAVRDVRSIIVADRLRASRAHDRFMHLGYSWPGVEPPGNK